MTDSIPDPHDRRASSSIFRRIAKWGGIAAGALLALVILVVAGGLIWLKVSNARYFDGYHKEDSVEATVLEKENLEGRIREKISFEGYGDTKIPALFHYPADATAQVPCVVLLYGIGQKMTFLDDIAGSYTDAGFGIICPEQLGQGERKLERGGPLSDLFRLRKRGSLTVLEARRILDYLENREEIDSDRFYLFGVSLGAILGTSALALEPRYKAGILMWGGGDFERLFGNRDGSGEQSSPERWLARFGAMFLEPADPIHRVQLISPRPLLFQNALHDEIIPRECTEAYYEKAGEPKEILWYDCGHETGLSRELILEILADQIEWLKGLETASTAKG